MTTPSYRKLYRSRREKILGGVCGGLAEYFNIDPTLVRLGFVALGVWGGSGALLYIIMWIVVPDEPEATVPPTPPGDIPPAA